ncbi:MAG: ferrous iron transport protein A [Opitutaceae bacterium]|nr:ferrous iron transport protein A [Verrucomicrobiales bacterium]
MADSSQTLTSLPIGHSATVTQINVPSESRGRLLEMGVLVGTPVQLIRFAPLGDPVEIRVRGYHLTLRRHDADQILVCPQAPVT